VSTSIRSQLTRALVWRIVCGLGLLSLLALAALHGLLARQQQEQLDRRVVKLTDIAVKAERDGAVLAQRLAEYAPRRPGTRLVVRGTDGTVAYSDPDLPAHTLSAHVRQAVFVPSGLVGPLPASQFEITIDVADDVELQRAMAAMLFAFTLLAALGARWAAASAVRQGLAPLDRMSEQLSSLAPANLGSRLSLHQPAAELEPWVERFNALLARLEGAYRQLESFNADVAHELRTPLNNLIGQTEVALSRPRTQAELHDVLSSNLEELHRLGHLVHDMLFLSRSDRGALARREDPVSLAALAQEVVDYHEAAIEERQLGVKIAGDAKVAVDAGLIRRAVSNLLSNAVRHAARKSTVLIDIGPASAPQGSTLELAVVNRGDDIAADDLPRIFDRFFRADASRNAGDVHHGLGLAIVAAIARMHGGQVVARSCSGETRIGMSIAGFGDPAMRSTTLTTRSSGESTHASHKVQPLHLDH
jgi:two-component system, OmpR family, heavy metal sensor histidine kinase CusS